MYHKQRYSEKVQMKKTIKMHEERNTKAKSDDNVPEGAVPAYLLDRETQTRAKVLSNMIKQKRKEKAVCSLVLFRLQLPLVDVDWLRYYTQHYLLFLNLC